MAEREVFRSSSSTPAAARAFVARVLDRLGRGHLADEAELVVGELVTNAVLHAAGDLAVEVGPRGGGVRIAVSDEASDHPRIGTTDLSEPGGLGLVIVEQVSERWGVEPDPAGGKTVWAELV